MEARLSSASQPESTEQLLAQTEWVRALVRRLLGGAREADVDDLVQDTMVKAMTTPVDHSRPVRGWLRTVATRLFYERHRRDTRRAGFESNAATPSRPLGPEEAVLLAERQRIVVECVLALAEPYRHVMLLRYVHEIPTDEIAVQLQVPVATVRSQLQRGRELVRDALKQRFDERGEDWAAALLPLAGWPDGVPPVPVTDPPPAGVPKTLLWPAAAAVVVLGGLTASVWWGDWWHPSSVDVDTAASAPRVATSEEPRATRRHVARPERSRGARAPGSDGTEAASVADSVDLLPESTPSGAIRVTVEGLPDDLRGPLELLIEPFHVSTVQLLRHGALQPASIALEGAAADIDLNRLFVGTDFAIADVLVTLRHPQLVPTRKRASPARDGDLGVPANFVVTGAATATGRVLDPAGVPVAGAVVMVGMETHSDRGQIVRRIVDETTTDDDGEYGVAIPPGASVRVFARAAGCAPTVKPVSGLAAGDRVALDLRLDRGLSIAGRVLVHEGDDPSVLTVSAGVHQFDTRPYQGRTGRVVVEDGRAVLDRVVARVQADGTFLLEGLAERQYRVGVGVVSGAHRSAESRQALRVPPLADLEFDRRLVGVPFVVTDENGPRAGVSVRATTGDPHEHLDVRAAAKTDAEGRVVLELLRGTKFTWSVDEPVVAVIGNEASTTPVTGSAGEIAIQLEPPAGASWSVRLHYPDGSPVEHAAFLAVPVEDPPRFPRPIEVDGVDGLFVVSGLRRGPHNVTIRVGAGWEDSRGFWREVTRQVSVPVATATERIDLSQRGGRLRVRISRDDVDSVVASCVVSRDGEVIPCTFAARQPGGGKGAGGAIYGTDSVDVLPVLAPGEYELVFTSHLCHAQRRTVTVREGWVEDVYVTFESL